MSDEPQGLPELEIKFDLIETSISRDLLRSAFIAGQQSAIALVATADRFPKATRQEILAAHRVWILGLSGALAAKFGKAARVILEELGEQAGLAGEVGAAVSKATTPPERTH